MYGKRGKDNPNSIPVFNITKNIRYDSATECAKKEKVKLSKICAVCRGERATTNNCVYRYIDKNNGSIIYTESKVQQKTIPVINLDTMERFVSIKEAQKKYDPNTHDALIQALKRGDGACIWKGFKWKYESKNINPDDIKKKTRSDAKKVKNVTTGETFDSISSVGKNYRNLATALRKGNGKCYYQKQYWEIIN